LFCRREVQEEALLLLVGDWVNSADPSLVDTIVFGLLSHCVLHHQSHTVAVPLSITISKSVLAAKHPLLSGMKNFVKKQGTFNLSLSFSRMSN